MKEIYRKEIPTSKESFYWWWWWWWRNNEPTRYFSNCYYFPRKFHTV